MCRFTFYLILNKYGNIQYLYVIIIYYIILNTFLCSRNNFKHTYAVWKYIYILLEVLDFPGFRNVRINLNRIRTSEMDILNENQWNTTPNPINFWCVQIFNPLLMNFRSAKICI